MKNLSYPHFGLLVIILIFFGTGLFSLNELNIYLPDSARYLIWANSLARGEGYKDASTPEPSRYVVHGPMYSLLLVPSQLIMPGSIQAAKVTSLLFGCLAIMLIFFWIKSKIGIWYALLGSFLFSIHPSTISYANQVLSDMPFAVCVLGTFIFCERLSENDSIDIKNEIGLLICLVSGLLLREVGAVLVVCSILFFVMRKQPRRVLSIFLTSAIMYLAWYVRNEIIVASYEHPVTQNTHIYFLHLYTSETASLLQEFLTRLRINSITYCNHILRLLFVSDFMDQIRSSFVLQNYGMNILFRSITIAVYSIVICSLAIVLCGLRQMFSVNRISFLVALFSIGYFVPILNYPIIDMRFLYPIYLVMLYWFILGVHWLMGKFRNNRYAGKYGRVLFISLVMLSQIPNLLMSYGLQKNNILYGSSPYKYITTVTSKNNAHEYFAKSLALAGEWICQHADSDAIVMTKWKELTFYLGGRKLIVSNAQMPPNEFSGLVRDYHVGYIVSTYDTDSLDEYQTVFMQSPRFVFTPVYRFGSLEIVAVQSKAAAQGKIYSAASSSMQDEFCKAFRKIESDPSYAEQKLVRLLEKARSNIELYFLLGVAKEFSGSLDSAQYVFNRICSLPQVGSMIQLSRYHLDVIAHLRRAMKSEEPTNQAQEFHIAALSVWEAGFRAFAVKLLAQSLKSDSSFFPSVITCSLFSLQQNDTLHARLFYAKAKAIDADNILVTNLQTFFRFSDSIRTHKNNNSIANVHLQLARTYEHMGLFDAAIDELLNVQALEPENQEVLTSLAKLYERKGKIYSAYLYYKKLTALNVLNNSIKETCDSLAIILH